MALSKADASATQGKINFVHKATGYKVALGVSREAAEEIARRVRALGPDSDVVELAADGDAGAQKLVADIVEDARRDVAARTVSAKTSPAKAQPAKARELVPEPVAKIALAKAIRAVEEAPTPKAQAKAEKVLANVLEAVDEGKSQAINAELERKRKQLEKARENKFKMVLKSARASIVERLRETTESLREDERLLKKNPGHKGFGARVASSRKQLEDLLAARRGLTMPGAAAFLDAYENREEDEDSDEAPLDTLELLADFSRQGPSGTPKEQLGLFGDEPVAPAPEPLRPPKATASAKEKSAYRKNLEARAEAAGIRHEGVVSVAVERDLRVRAEEEAEEAERKRKDDEWEEAERKLDEARTAAEKKKAEANLKAVAEKLDEAPPVVHVTEEQAARRARAVGMTIPTAKAKDREATFEEAAKAVEKAKTPAAKAKAEKKLVTVAAALDEDAGPSSSSRATLAAEKAQRIAAEAQEKLPSITPGIYETGDATHAKVRLPRGPVFGHKCQGDMCRDVSHRRIHTLSAHIEHLSMLVKESPLEEASARALEVFAELQKVAQRAIDAAKIAAQLDKKARTAQAKLEKKVAQRIAHDPQHKAMEAAFEKAEAQGGHEAAKAAMTIGKALDERVEHAVAAVAKEEPGLHKEAVNGAEEAAQAAATAEAALAHVEALKGEVEEELRAMGAGRVAMVAIMRKRVDDHGSSASRRPVMARPPFTPVKRGETVQLKDAAVLSMEGDFAVV